MGPAYGGPLTTIREAGTGDVPGLARLRAVWVAEQERAPVDDPNFEKRYREWMDANPRKFFVAHQDGEVIGMLNLMVFGRRPQTWEGRRHGAERPQALTRLGQYNATPRELQYLTVKGRSGRRMSRKAPGKEHHAPGTQPTHWRG
ncbi:hypothetical protein ABIB35_002265 [Arthrobacter sp. UYP6]